MIEDRHLFDIPAGFDEWAGHPDLKAAVRLMARCRLGCGGKHALSDAHAIMADCYGMLGQMIADIINWRKAKVAAARALLDLQAQLDAAQERKEPGAEVH